MYITSSDFCNKYGINISTFQSTIRRKKIRRLREYGSYYNYYFENDLNDVFGIEDIIPSRLNLSKEHKFDSYFELFLKPLFKQFCLVNDMDEDFKEYFIEKISTMIFEDVFWMIKYPNSNRTKKWLRITHI